MLARHTLRERCQSRARGSSRSSGTASTALAAAAWADRRARPPLLALLCAQRMHRLAEVAGDRYRVEHRWPLVSAISVASTSHPACDFGRATTSDCRYVPGSARDENIRRRRNNCSPRLATKANGGCMGWSEPVPNGVAKSLHGSRPERPRAGRSAEALRRSLPRLTSARSRSPGHGGFAKFWVDQAPLRIAYPVSQSDESRVRLYTWSTGMSTGHIHYSCSTNFQKAKAVPCL